MIKRVYKEEQEMARLYCVILFVTLVSDRIGKQPSTHVVREELQTTVQQGCAWAFNQRLKQLSFSLIQPHTFQTLGSLEEQCHYN